MNIIPFRVEHLAQIKNLQEVQRSAVSDLPPKWLQLVAQANPAVSAVVNDQIIGSAGIIVSSSGTGFLWGAISQDAGPHFIAMHRAALRLLEMPRLARIEAMVECDFHEGSRWLDLLGFRFDGRVSNDGLHGEDHYRYVWTPPRMLLN
jgi:hypothetical protein